MTIPGKRLIAALFMAALFACSNGNQRVDELAWLVGTWRSESDHGFFYEKWHRVNAHRMEGYGYEEVAGDTIFEERLKIQGEKDAIYYVASIPSNSAPVAYRLVASGEGEAIFENSEHTFPQRLVYHLQPEGTLFVVAETMGGESRVEFNFERADEGSISP